MRRSLRAYTMYYGGVGLAFLVIMDFINTHNQWLVEFGLIYIAGAASMCALRDFRREVDDEFKQPSKTDNIERRQEVELINSPSQGGYENNVQSSSPYVFTGPSPDSEKVQ